jgi:hypothetical protein
MGQPTSSTTWAMMIFGFAGIGFMAYRRKKNGGWRPGFVPLGLNRRRSEVGMAAATRGLFTAGPRGGVPIRALQADT